jgi:D-alanyl-D-alanine endopeptidase (penicillin-binding protein 7)
MPHPHRVVSAPALRRLAASFWTALLAAFLVLAPLEGFSAPAKGKAVASKTKKTKSAAKKRAASRKVVAKKGSSKKKVAARKASSKKSVVAKRNSRKAVVAKKRAAPVVRLAPLPADPEKLALKSSVAYVVDMESEEVLFGRNAEDVRPIASLTKIMTGLIVTDAGLPLDEKITITSDDVDRLKHSSSRLRVGTTLTRRQALHLALMSSENRAAHALARTYPGGVSAFVSAMNNKARELGMAHTRYVDPTGLSSQNRSSARDLAMLADAAYDRPLLRKYSTSPGYQLAVGKRSLQYVNTNRLVRSGEWDIGLQKTGYISEAGQCLVVQTKVKGRNLIMVFLDSASKVTRINDAELLKRWLRKHSEIAGTHRAEES